MDTTPMTCKDCGAKNVRYGKARLCTRCYSRNYAETHKEQRRAYFRRHYDSAHHDARINRKVCGYQQRAMWQIWELCGGYTPYARMLMELQRITDAAEAPEVVGPRNWGFTERERWRALLRLAGCKEPN
jgi:hypothetical protein